MSYYGLTLLLLDSALWMFCDLLPKGLLLLLLALLLMPGLETLGTSMVFMVVVFVFVDVEEIVIF